MNDIVLEISGISRGFPGVQALQAVSFEVQRGTVHGLVGENGAGKSTLIKILSGALQPDAGEMRLNGESYHPQDPQAALKAGVATIYQEFNLLEFRSVAHNILLGQEPSRGGLLDFASMHRQAGEVLSSLKASAIALDQPVESLKVSQKQIVEISRALVHHSSLLIMDEPTSALTSEEVDALFEIIDNLRSQGVTILYVTHRLAEIFRLADRVTVLRDGQHIRTCRRAETTPDRLITDMIGRRLEGVYPERNRQLGPAVMQVDGLTSGQVFREVSFELHAGEVLGITGLGGSGKTELGKALFGDWPLDSGSIFLEGQALRMSPSRAIRYGLGYVAEDRKLEGVIQDLPVRRNLSLPVLSRLADRLGLLQRRAEEQVARRQVESLDIKTPSLEQLLANLSGGNQQKVSLGKWLASEARIFILLEPTQGIDVAVKFEFYNLIERLSKEGTAFVLISSEMVEILGLAHRILVMHAGRVVAELAGESTSQEEILRYALAGKDGRPAAEGGNPSAADKGFIHE